MARVYRGPQPMLLCIDENHGILACGRSPFDKVGIYRGYSNVRTRRTETCDDVQF
jgi:hypothetical protein